MDGEIWGEASVTYPDWQGTAQLDERKTTPSKPLAQTVGLNHDQWQVVGFSIGGGERGYELHVLATPRELWENVRANDEAELEVTDFLVHDVDPLSVLQRMTHMFQLNMRSRGIGRRVVVIKAKSDLPTELFVEENFGPQGN